MKLFDLFKDVNYKILKGDNCEITGLSMDSRSIKNGHLFVCIEGLKSDSHDFIEQAINNGAKAVIVEKDVDLSNMNATIVKVDNSRIALSYVASRFYNDPHKKLNIIGITGTNGKTSTTYFIESILEQYNKKVGVIGTIEKRIAGVKIDTELSNSTTPDSIELMQIFNDMVGKTDYVVMEVSSHALELHKVEGVEFEIAVFTNLTQDHLDFHKTFGNYVNAKSKLFEQCKHGIINVDDSYANDMIKNSDCEIITYSIDDESDIKAKNIEYHNDMVRFEVEIDDIVNEFIIPIPGKFTVYNSLAAIATAITLKIPIDVIIKGLKKIKGVPGRIQNIPNTKGISVIVDYSHTPDSLENIIKAVREYIKGNITTVFGCGGDRDKTKRPIMGRIAGELSDYCIITSDNPRTESPEIILSEVEVGVKETDCNYSKIIDRKEAIFYAIKNAKENDAIIIAGKGHENYQIFSDKTIHFDDVEVAIEALEG